MIPKQLSESGEGVAVLPRPTTHDSGGDSPSAEAATPPDEKAVAKEYEREVRTVREKLRRLAERSDSAIWEHATFAYGAVRRFEKEYESLRTREQLYSDISVGQKWAPRTVKKRILAVEWLHDARLGHVATEPRSGFHQISDIVGSGLSQQQKVDLVGEIYCHDAENPNRPFTVIDVRKRIAQLKPSEPARSDTSEPSDFLSVRGFDDRFGNPGNPHRLPGRAIIDFIHRWMSAGGNVLGAFAGDGTVLDAATSVHPTGDHHAIEMELDPQLNTKYPGRIMAFDAAKPDFAGSVPEGWAAALAVLAPPEPTASRVIGNRPGTVLFRELEYPEFLAGIVRNVVALLAPDGVVAVVTKGAMSGTDGHGAVDLEFEIAKVLHESKDLKFASRGVLHIATSTAKDRLPNEPKSLVLHVLVFRRGA